MSFTLNLKQLKNIKILGIERSDELEGIGTIKALYNKVYYKKRNWCDNVTGSASI